MDAKLNQLETLLRATNGAIVAFSAGVDSTFLLKIASDILGERAIALTAASPTVPPGELEAAKDLTEFWCDRLEMIALMCNFKKFQIYFHH